MVPLRSGYGCRGGYGRYRAEMTHASASLDYWASSREPTRAHRSWRAGLIAAACLVVGVWVLPVRPGVVLGESMAPFLHNGQVFLMSRLPRDDGATAEPYPNVSRPNLSGPWVSPADSLPTDTLAGVCGSWRSACRARLCFRPLQSQVLHSVGTYERRPAQRPGVVRNGSSKLMRSTCCAGRPLPAAFPSRFSIQGTV